MIGGMISTLRQRQNVLRLRLLAKHQNETQALRLSLRHERASRKAAEEKIAQLEKECLQLKESRSNGANLLHNQANLLRNQLEGLQLVNSRLSQTANDLTAANALLLKQVGELQHTNKQQSDKITNMGITLAWFYKQYFGRKTEKLQPEPTNQSSVGNSATTKTSASESQPQPEPEVQPKRKRGQQPDSPGHGRTNRSHLPVDEDFIEIPNCVCDVCLRPYSELPETDDSEVIEVTFQARIKRYRRKKYVSRCRCKGKKLVTAPAPAKLYPHTNIGSSLWAYLLAWRYLHGVPTNRILQQLALSKLPLSAGTITGGYKKIEGFLEILYRPIIAHCQSSTLWNADETTWRVFEDNDGTRSKKQWWFWLIASNDAVVYLLDKSRSKEIPNGFFTASSGVLMTDRLASYKSLSTTIKKAWCWVHVKRDFLKVFQGAGNLKDWAKVWLTDIGSLFALNHKRVQLWQSNQPCLEAHTAVENHIHKLKEYWQAQLQQPELLSQQKKVLNSLKNHWDGLILFLTDPHIPLENNRAERLLRNIVVSRKNSYGSGKEWAGMLAAKLFTIFQTWLINGLDPQALLLDYLNQCSLATGKPPPVPSSFLPWKMSEERKQTFSIPKTIKRPA
jgi:transposase